MHRRFGGRLGLFVITGLLLAANAGSQAPDERGVIQQVLGELTGTFSVPIGKTRLAANDVAQLRRLETAGLVVMREIPQQYWDSFLNRTQGLGTPVEIAGTQKLMSLQPTVVPVNGQDLRIFRVKIADVTIDEITTDQDYTGQLSSPGEKYRIMLGIFRKSPTSAAAIFGAGLATQAEERLKFRGVVKYDQFAKAWTFVALDTGLLNTNDWLSANVR